MKWYFYIDWGSGYALVNPVNLDDCNLKLKRGELNDFIQRKELEGSFTLIDTDATNAKTFFIDNGNFEAPIRIYENGISGVGILKFEGWVRKQGAYDFRRNQITLTNARTKDVYTDFLPKINNKFYGDSIAGYGQTNSNFASQGQHINCNKLYNITFSGSNFTINGDLSLSNVGRISLCETNDYIVVFDNLNDTLTAYAVTASAWVQVAQRTGVGEYGRNVSLASLGSSSFQLTSEVGFTEKYTISVPNINLVPLSRQTIQPCKHLSTCRINTGSSIALVDETSNSLTGIGGASISLGEISKPSVASVDLSNSIIAFIDAKQKKLKAFSLSGTTWSELASLQLSGLFAPKIYQYTTNSIILHDTISGKLEKYNLSTAPYTWVKDGNTLTLSGGYTSGLAVRTSDQYIGLLMSDSFIFNGSASHSYYQLINGLLFKNEIDPTFGGNYNLDSGVTSGCDINVDDLIIGDMSDVNDNIVDGSSINYYDYDLKSSLELMELFQNYWYIDATYKIKFTQPALFSSFGTSYNISSLDAASQLNQRIYKDDYDISQEEIVFLNSQSADFRDNKIDYNRNTPIIVTKNYNITTDFQHLIRIYTGQIITDIENTGLILHIKDNTLPFNTCASGTGIISGSDTKNYLLSQSQIYNDYWKDYRYQESGNITINGSSSAVQNTVRNIIEFPEIKLSYGQLGITEFPDSVSSLTWDTGVISWITEFSVSLGKNEITINSRLLDL